MAVCSNCGTEYKLNIPAQKYCNKTPCNKDREKQKRARAKAKKNRLTNR